MHKLGVMIVAGAICLLLGLIFIFVGMIVQGEANQIESLPLLTTVADIRDSEDGRAASIDARIAERNDLYDEGLVAYVRQEHRGQKCNNSDDDCEPLWVEDDRVTPPLWLDISDGRLLLTQK